MRRRAVTFGAALACGSLLAGATAWSGGCSYSWQFTNEGGPPNESAPDTFVPPGPDTSVVDSSMTDGSQASDAAAVPCKSNAECFGATYCSFPDFQCGKVATGSCVSPNTGCKADEFVCSCDGVTRKTPCEAAGVRVDVSANEGCAPPVNMYRCGYRFCSSKEFCVTTSSAAGVDYACMDFMGCVAANCTCSAVTSFTAANGCTSCDDTTKVGETRVKCP